MNNTYKTNKTDWRRLVRSILFVALLLAALPAEAQISGGKVTLDDREPHTWSYYSDASLPTQLRSLNPADVTITYHGLGSNTVTAASSTEAVDNPTSFSRNATGVKVNYDADDSVFIYHKTLERTSGSEFGSATYAYTTIPNPFQVRPTGNTGSVTVTPDTRTVYISWSSTYWTRNTNQATVRFSYTDADGVVQTSGYYTSNGNTTIQAKVGTKITVYSKSCRNGYTNYSPTITARYDNGSGTQIVSYQNTSTTENSSTSTNNITASSSTFTASKYRGFYKWRIKKITGGSIKSADGTVTYTQYSGSGAVASTNMLDAEETYHFIPSAATGMSVDLEALWAQAYVSTSGAEAHSVGVERNFYVITASATSNITAGGYPCTYTSLYPDGTTNETNAASSVSVYKYGGFTAAADSKIENIILRNNNSTINAAGHNLTIGRGVSGYNGGLCATNLYGATSAPTSSFTLRVESGTYTTSYLLHGTQNNAINASAAITMNATYGCDYDRANNNTNTNLRFSSVVEVGIYAYCTSASAAINMTVLSGTFGANSTNNEFYLGFENGGGSTSQAVRTFEMYGGNMLGGVAGGFDQSNNSASSVKVNMRIRGGTIHQYLYAAGQYSECSGARRIIITGGTFDAWIAGGAYGRDNEKGNTNGNMYIYFGGEANQTNTEGVFGAGYGIYAEGNDKYTVQAVAIVFADEATTAGSVYGGGNHGYAKQDIQVYVTGGHVAGNVFGGANEARSSQDVAVVVTGGSVDGGVYGGSNQSGAISGAVTVDVYGTDPQPGSGYAINQVFGGGNVAAYSGTPVVTVHDDNGCDISIGEVYGGGNAATVLGTDVTIEAGNRIGNVYGGCYGANVTTNGTKVNIKGGTIEHVYGGNNQSGTITGAIRVRAHKDSDCPMKIGELYGGGNMAASNVGSIDIGCTGTYVEGAGGHDDCNETDNRIGYELEGIHEVYGGANQANITGNINLTIDSGMVYRVFGGNNNSGSISGTITVNIGKVENTCGWYVGYVYGGGFNAPYSNAGTSNPSVNVTNGLVSHSVFGGGKGNGAVVTGNPLVTLSNTAQVGENVYGGGDAAPVTGNTSVILKN